jgi:hypothetical protein
VPIASDGIASATIDGLERGLQIGMRQAPQRARPEDGGDGVPGRRDNDRPGLPGALRIWRAGRFGDRRPRLRRIARRGMRRHPGDASGELRIARQQRAPRVDDRDREEIDGQGAQPCDSGLRRERDGAHERPWRRLVGPARDNAAVTFTRIAWLVTVLACLVTCVAMLLSGYQGYAALVFAVGVCAAINLR